MTPDEMKDLLDGFDRAMKAEGIGQGVRSRVISRLLYGQPHGIDYTVTLDEPGEPEFRRFLRAARREMPVRQNSMLRPV